MTKLKKSTLPNRWDRRERPATGDETPDSLYHAVGIALSNWESLDERLTQIFSRILEAKYDYADAALGSAYTSSGRLTMIKKVVEYATASETVESRAKDSPDSARERLDVLRKLTAYLNTVENFQGRRNDIAHGIVKSLVFNDVPRGYLLEPAKYDIKKTDSHIVHTAKTGSFFVNHHGDWRDHQLTKYAFNSDDVRYYAEQFRLLCEIASRFVFYFTFGQQMPTEPPKD